MKTFMKIMAAMAAIAGAAVVLYHFRDKLKALCPCCKCREDGSDFEPCCYYPVQEESEEVAPAEETPVEEAKEEVNQEETDVTSEDFED